VPNRAPLGRARRLAFDARLLAYSSGNFGKALIFSGADLTILFLLTDLMGLSASASGTLMLMALAGDLVFDLLAAMLVIRMRRSGRGYRWLIAAGAVPCGAAFAILYATPALGLRQGWMLAGALLAFRGAYAIIDVPHNALMARITSDSRARGRVSGYRLFFSTLGALAIATILTPVVQHAGQDRAFTTLAATGAIGAMLFIGTMMLCVLATRGLDREPERAAAADGIAIPLRNRLVVAMLLLAVITGLAVPMFGRMLLYVCAYVLDRPDLAGALLLAMTLGQFAGVLAWTSLTGRQDKSRLLAMGHAVSAVGILCFALSLRSPALLSASAALIGFGFAGVFMLPWGLLADTVDFVAWRDGRRLETGLFAGYLVALKVSGAGSTVLIGWSLGWLGYVSGQPQTASVQAGMLALGLAVPLAGCLCAVALLRRFAIGHRRHAVVRRALDRRAARRPAQSGAEPVSGLNFGLAKSIGEGSIRAGGIALSAQARHSMSRSIAAPAAVCE
jgi:GPH family glycoside/pentoside/hexuronide:cation symporter